MAKISAHVIDFYGSRYVVCPVNDIASIYLNTSEIYLRAVY